MRCACVGHWNGMAAIHVEMLIYIFFGVVSYFFPELYMYIHIVMATGTKCIMRGFNPRSSSEEPDLVPPLTINLVI